MKKVFLLWLKQCTTDLSLAGELQLEAKKTFENAFEHKVKLNEMFSQMRMESTVLELEK